MNEQGLPGHRGAVYIGASAFREMAGLVDFLPPEQHRKLSDYAQAAEIRVHELENELDKWKQVFDELARIGLLGDAMRNRLGDLLDSGVQTLPIEQLREDEPAETDSVPDESSSKSGPDDSASPQPAKRAARKTKSSGAF